MKHMYISFAVVLMCCVTKCEVEDNRNFETARVDSILENFNPLRRLIGERGTDKNSYLFQKSAGWDTTYVLANRKDSSSITGIYQGISPVYYQTLVFYEGFSFELDSSTWEKVIAGADRLLDTLNHELYTGCVDCSYYALSYDSEFTRVNKHNKADFETYERFLWKSLIYPVLKEKQKLFEGQKWNTKKQ